jgi:hypothetical protein
MNQSPEGDFRSTNPHALAVILEASETRSIIASSDIFDIRGNLLWARNQPVSNALQRRLMDRALKNPIEACLIAEDGVDIGKLTAAMEGLLAGDGVLAPMLRPHAGALRRGMGGIHLHPVVQLLLSAAQTARPALFGHAVEAMALAGALTCATRDASDAAVTAAMTAGLLHDIGEVYAAPEFGEADAATRLDVETYRQLVVHPHVGQVLLQQLTDYPADIARAVGEHHEHLDGSGYPHRATGEALSSLGRLLAAVEEALSVLRVPGADLHHVGVALRVIPHEFDDTLVGPFIVAARSASPMAARRSVDDLRQRLSRLDAALRHAPERVREALPEPCSEPLRRIADLTLGLLQRLRDGWNESGLWSPDGVDADHLAEAEAVQDALRSRLLEIGRVARLASAEASDDDRACVERICALLIEGLVRPA